MDVEKVYSNIEKAYEDTVKDFLKIDEHNLDSRLNNHSSVFAFFGSVLAFAKMELEKCELALQAISSKYKDECRNSTSKKVPAHEIADYVDSKEEVLEQKKKIIEAEYKYNLVKGIVSALGNQRDMLIQISSNRRQEQKLITEN